MKQKEMGKVLAKIEGEGEIGGKIGVKSGTVKSGTEGVKSGTDETNPIFSLPIWEAQSHLSCVSTKKIGGWPSL